MFRESSLLIVIFVTALSAATFSDWWSVLLEMGGEVFNYWLFGTKNDSASESTIDSSTTNPVVESPTDCASSIPDLRDDDSQDFHRPS